MFTLRAGILFIKVCHHLNSIFASYTEKFSILSYKERYLLNYF